MITNNVPQYFQYCLNAQYSPNALTTGLVGVKGYYFTIKKYSIITLDTILMPSVNNLLNGVLLACIRWSSHTLVIEFNV